MSISLFHNMPLVSYGPPQTMELADALKVVLDLDVRTLLYVPREGTDEEIAFKILKHSPQFVKVHFEHKSEYTRSKEVVCERVLDYVEDLAIKGLPPGLLELVDRFIERLQVKNPDSINRILHERTEKMKKEQGSQPSDRGGDSPAATTEPMTPSSRSSKSSSELSSLSERRSKSAPNVSQYV